MSRMKKAKVQNGRGCLIWHRWEKVNDDGCNEYHLCKDCGCRIARQYTDGPTDFDWHWIFGLKENQQ